MDNAAAEILANIRKNIPVQKVAYPKVPTFEQPGADLLQIFTENVLKAGASFYRVTSVTEAQNIAAGLYPDARVICSAAPEWKGNKDLDTITDPRALQDVDLAVVRADFGVAEMGMVWLTEDDLKINSLGFLCQNIAVLLDPKDITENMHTAYQHTDLDKNNYGCFVMGPSATADIGATLVHGAQGPRTLVVFLLER